MKVCVASPYPLEDLKGNSVTTRRVVELLRAGGHEARASHGWDGRPAEVLISLHAVKGAEAVFQFCRQVPGGGVIILMTGTDLYRDLENGSESGTRALRMADAIVVVQEAAIARLPAEVREKAVVIAASLHPIAKKACPVRPPFAISVVGHPRPVKRPFLTIEAVSRHPEWQAVEVWQIGAALDEDSRRQAEEWVRRDSRYRWFGGLPREEALALCAQSSLTVNSSRLEGGANAVLEAMTMGVPVLASRIEGNAGLLGEQYPGYFEEGRLDQKLAEILEGRIDLDSWVAAATARLPLFAPEKEKLCWLELLAKLNYRRRFK